MVYKIEFYAYLPKIQIYIFFKFRIIVGSGFFSAEQDTDPVNIFWILIPGMHAYCPTKKSRPMCIVVSSYMKWENPTWKYKGDFKLS